MSVLIKDMAKPKSCRVVIDGKAKFCPFVNTDDDCVLLLEKGICEGTWEEQYADCPLIELPEKHGRLIDADDVKSRMIPLSFSVQKWIDEVELSNCKTVIEAEGDEE